VSTPARTLFDLSTVWRPRTVEEAIERADRLGLFDLRAVRRVLERNAGRPGAPTLRAVLARLATTDASDTRSPLEVGLLQLCDDYGLPAPIANVTIAGLLVDFHWPGTDLVVETDGFAFHRTRRAFDADRERDQTLALDGYRVVRFTHDQVVRRPAETAIRLRRLIARSGSPSGQ
jgi:hypothetical protein